jgi:hypothetical protein
MLLSLKPICGRQSTGYKIIQQGLGCGGQIINEIGIIGLLVRATDKTKANLIPTESNTHLN